MVGAFEIPQVAFSGYREALPMRQLDFALCSAFLSVYRWPIDAFRK
jgi:hypothetical protein